MAKRLVVGNWKLNLGPATGLSLVEEFLAENPPLCDVNAAFCVPFPLLSPLHDAILQSGMGLGAQDVFWKASGAFTGFVSAGMLKEIGVTHVIIGHSERRGRFGKLEVEEADLPFFGETDRTVNLKTRAVLEAGLVPIVCVGETLDEREAGKTDDVIRTQIRGALEGIESFTGVFAYEPVWAIGTGKTCDAAEAARVCALVTEAARGARTLYGGSVSASNAAELFSHDSIAGGLVGGASLKAKDFAAIVSAAKS